MKAMGCVLALAILLLPSLAQAGVTVYYEGYAVSAQAVTEVIALAAAIAKKHSWRVVDASSPSGHLQRVVNEQNRDYKGRISGIMISIAPMCEPLTLQFGDDLFMQDSAKTQFAGADIHIQVVALLDALAPHFKKLEVFDDSDYWNTRSRKTLEAHILQVNSMLQELRAKNPQSQGPVVMPSGRILDYLGPQ